MLFIYFLISFSYPYESSDIWEGPENFIEFMEYHKYPKASRSFATSEENTTVTIAICDYSEETDIHYCYYL